MIRALPYWLILVCIPTLSHAGGIYDTFRGGVLGVPWGATLDTVSGIYPDGDHVFSTTPGERGYWVKDGAPFLDVPRPANGVLFGFNETNHVSKVAVGFAFERALELRNRLTTLFGVPTSKRVGERKTVYFWKADNGIECAVWEMGEAHQQIVWLVVSRLATNK